MKKNLFWSILTMVMVVCMSVCLASCGDDDDNGGLTPNENGSEEPMGNSTEKVENRELLGYWYFNGNIAHSFLLYSDGTGIMYDKDSSNSHSVTWFYDTENKILAFSDGYTLTIKLITSDMLSAEWSSVKYGTRTDTWIKKWDFDWSKINDPGWKKLIVGTWTINYSNGHNETVTFNNGKFTYTGHFVSAVDADAKSANLGDSAWDLTITGTYDDEGNMVSDERFNLYHKYIRDIYGRYPNYTYYYGFTNRVEYLYFNNGGEECKNIDNLTFSVKVVGNHISVTFTGDPVKSSDSFYHIQQEINENKYYIVCSAIGGIFTYKE